MKTGRLEAFSDGGTGNHHYDYDFGNKGAC